MPRTKKEVDKKLYDDLKQYLPDVAESSIKAYMTNLNHIATYLDQPLSVSLFKDFDSIRKDLEELNYSKSTLKNKISSIVTYLRMYDAPAETIQRYSDFMDALSGKLSREAETMTKSDKEEHNWMTKPELEQYADKLKSELPKKPTSYADILKWAKYIVLAFHIKYPMRNELSDIAIVYNMSNIDPNLNYFIVDKKKGTVKVLIQKFKTSKTYKEINIDVIPSLAKDIIEYCKHLSVYKKNNGVDNDWLLINKKNEKFSRNDYTFFVQSIFEPLGKKISTTIIRKIIVSDLYDVGRMKELARVMGHSVELAVSTYAKEQ
jgi:hypothetical protein